MARDVGFIKKRTGESESLLEEHKDLSVYLDIDIDTAILYIYIYSRIHTYIPYIYIYIYMSVYVYFICIKMPCFLIHQSQMAESPPRWCRSDSSGKRSWGPCRAARPATELG